MIWKEPRYTRSDLTVANVFTAARLVLIPIFGWLWLRGQEVVALWLFVAAAVTDVLDGFFARWLNQKSRLGALLDPIADKLLVLVALLIGILRGEVPIWLAAVIIGRDAIMAVGVTLLGTRWKEQHGPAHWRPTRIGKYAMFLQSVTIALLIVDSAVAVADLRAYVQVAMLWTAVLTLVAGAQYTIRASRALAQEKPSP